MKRFILIFATTFAAIVLTSFTACAGLRNDVVIAYDQIHNDASLKQFKKATKVNQIEILNYLVTCANKEYIACQTIDDLYNVKEQLEIIKFYNNTAKQKSISVTNSIRKLDNEITQAEAIYKKEAIIEGSRTHYQDRGQDY